MKVFWFPSATLVLDQLVNAEGEQASLSHYARSYYVAAKSVEEALYLLGGIARSEGATVVEHDPPEEAPRSQIPAVVHPAQVDRKLGLLWRSGRAFFPLT